eukprot:1377592-Amorphochlora_amoeboformis.AAC.1
MIILWTRCTYPDLICFCMLNPVCFNRRPILKLRGIPKGNSNIIIGWVIIRSGIGAGWAATHLVQMIGRGE